MSNPWFRLYSEFATDPKVQMMSEAMQRRLIVLMCLRCSDVTVTGDVTERDSEVAFALRISDAELIETKALFERKGFIDSEWNLVSWEKRQCPSDTSAERMRRHRAKKSEQGSDAGDDALRHGDGADKSRGEERRVDQKAPLSVGKVEPTDSRDAPPATPSTIVTNSETSQEPSRAGLACRALIKAGVTGVNPSHPKLLAILDAGVPLDEIENTARELMAKGKGNLAYVCTAIAARRAEQSAAPSIGNHRAPRAPTGASTVPYDGRYKVRRDPAAGAPTAASEIFKTLGITPPTVATP